MASLAQALAGRLRLESLPVATRTTFLSGAGISESSTVWGGSTTWPISGPLHGLDDHAISPGELESGGIEMIDLDPTAEDDPYDFGH